MLARIFTLMFFVAAVSAETRTYLVYRAAHFPQDRYLYSISPQEFKSFIDTGKKNIDEASGQPFRMTAYELNYNGKYALWTVSFKNEDEKWRLDSMEQKNYVVLLSSREVVSVYDSQRGGTVQVLESVELAQLPTDYYEITDSTPMP